MKTIITKTSLFAAMLMLASAANAQVGNAWLHFGDDEIELDGGVVQVTVLHTDSDNLKVNYRAGLGEGDATHCQFYPEFVFNGTMYINHVTYGVIDGMDAFAREMRLYPSCVEETFTAENGKSETIRFALHRDTDGRYMFVEPLVTELYL